MYVKRSNQRSRWQVWFGTKKNNAEKNLTGVTPCLFFCLFEMVMKGWL